MIHQRHRRTDRRRAIARPQDRALHYSASRVVAVTTNVGSRRHLFQVPSRGRHCADKNTTMTCRRPPQQKLFRQNSKIQTLNFLEIWVIRPERSWLNFEMLGLESSGVRVSAAAARRGGGVRSTECLQSSHSCVCCPVLATCYLCPEGQQLGCETNNSWPHGHE